MPRIGYGRFNALIELIDARGRIVDYKEQCFAVLQDGKKTYLNMVSFYVPPIGTKGEKLLNLLPSLNDSPYAGVAIPFLSYHGKGSVPSYETLHPLLKKVRHSLQIDPWPWIFLNRMVGTRKGDSRVEGFDLDDDAGARTDMLAVWRMAVRAAQEWNSPGIVLDTEFYSNRNMYNPELVAEARGTSVEQTVRECELLGEELAKIIAEEYPQCIVWSLFSMLNKTYIIKDTGKELLTVPGYITLGMLKYARLMDIPMKFLCGGETPLGYISKDTEDLLRKITVRDNMMGEILRDYPEHFFLAGTIAPFHKYQDTTGWIKKRYRDKGNSYNTIKDFDPMFDVLFNAYDWVWIYAATHAKMEPFNNDVNQRYYKVIRNSLERASAHKDTENE